MATFNIVMPGFTPENEARFQRYVKLSLKKNIDMIMILKLLHFTRESMLFLDFVNNNENREQILNVYPCLNKLLAVPELDQGYAK